MISEPNTPQPVIPFKMPHLTPVLDAPSPLVPESAAFMNFQVFQTEKANLEFMPVKFRTPEHRARLVIVKAQCEELEKQVMLERMVAQIVQMRQVIKELKGRPRKHGRKPGPISARARKQRLADREAIAAKRAELSKLETAKAQLSGMATVTKLHPMTRNQFLKMVGMTVLATAVWNRAAAHDGGGDSGSMMSLASDASIYLSSSSNMQEDLMVTGWDKMSEESDDDKVIAKEASGTPPSGCIYPIGMHYIDPSTTGVKGEKTDLSYGQVQVDYKWFSSSGKIDEIQGTIEERLVVTSAGVTPVPVEGSKPAYSKLTVPTPFNGWEFATPNNPPNGKQLPGNNPKAIKDVITDKHWAGGGNTPDGSFIVDPLDTSHFIKDDDGNFTAKDIVTTQDLVFICKGDPSLYYVLIRGIKTTRSVFWNSTLMKFQFNTTVVIPASPAIPGGVWAGLAEQTIPGTAVTLPGQ